MKPPHCPRSPWFIRRNPFVRLRYSFPVDGETMKPDRKEWVLASLTWGIRRVMMSSASESLPTDTTTLSELLDVLSHPYRRRILTYLIDQDPRDGDEFDQQALADEADSDSWKIGLFHNHLPKLDDAGFIDWDRADGMVRPGPRFDEIAPVVARTVNSGDDLQGRWP